MRGYDLHASCVPSTKRFNDKRLEDDPQRAAVIGVLVCFFRLSHVDDGGGSDSGPIDNSVLSWRDNADIKGYHRPSVLPSKETYRIQREQ